jgi:death-on-curing protein
MGSDLPTAEDVMITHEIIEEEQDLKYTGTMKAAPELKIRRDVLSDLDEHDDVAYRAAAMLHGLISLHVFEDGNKRTAWMVTEDYLERNGISPPEQTDLAVRVIKNTGRYSTGELAAWLVDGEIDHSKLPPKS